MWFKSVQRQRENIRLFEGRSRWAVGARLPRANSAQTYEVVIETLLAFPL